MTVRIRYEAYDDSKEVYDQVSVRNFHSKSTDAMYIVYLDTKNVTYRVKNMTSRRTYEGGEGVNNLHVLKRNVKERLAKLGVEFNSEIRDNSTRIPGKNCGYKGEKNEADI